MPSSAHGFSPYGSTPSFRADLPQPAYMALGSPFLSLLLCQEQYGSLFDHYSTVLSNSTALLIITVLSCSSHEKVLCRGRCYLER